MTSTDDALHVFVTGLKNAHAMEKQALSILTPQAKRIENYPDLLARIELHIQETEGQIQRLDAIFSQLEESHSGFKDLALSITGSMAALGHAAAGDEVLKDTFANYAFEHFEIAAYTSLIGLSRRLSLTYASGFLEQNLDEERSMAQWIGDNIEMVTDRYVALRAADMTAKR